MKLKISIALTILFANISSVCGQNAPLGYVPFPAPQRVFVPKDPLREIDGKIYSAATMSRFYGLVLEVQPTGIRIRGVYGDPKGTMDGPGVLDWGFGPKKFEEGDGTEFFVEGFPYEVAENDFLQGDMYLAALERGVYTYTTTQGGSRTIHKLVYGNVIHIPINQFMNRAATGLCCCISINSPF